jgi:hypothetical protein
MGTRQTFSVRSWSLDPHLKKESKKTNTQLHGPGLWDTGIQWLNNFSDLLPLKKNAVLIHRVVDGNESDEVGSRAHETG